jgi:hypothetical protein
VDTYAAKLKDADAARKRFAFEEVFLIQLERQRESCRSRRKKFCY